MLPVTVTGIVLFSAMALARSKPVIDHKLLDAGTLFPVNIFITMREDTDSILATHSAGRANYANSETERHTLYTRLVQNSKESQAPLLRHLQDAGGGAVHPRSFWITNQIYVQGADARLLEMLRDREDISRIHLEANIQLDKPRDFASVPPPGAPGYNLELIGVPEVWANGVNGTGLVVGTVDTGVRVTHEALWDSYRNDEYSWKDTINRLPTPYDDNGQGTAHMGVLVGGMDVGVAPGAQWISCKAFDETGIGYEASVMECVEWMVCPKNAAGVENCSKAPHIVSNGWTMLTTDPWVDSIVEVLRRVGIILVSNAGNYGQEGCRSIGFPSYHSGILTVGATDDKDRWWEYSSQGPSPVEEELIKPEVTAPGVNVVSTCYESDTAYCTVSGTSIAAQQVAGIVAMVLEVAPWLRQEEIRDILQATAEKNLESAGAECRGVPDSSFPNFQFGYGRVDALAVYEHVRRLEPPTDSPEDLPWLVIGGAVAGTVLLVTAAVSTCICWRKRQSAKRRRQDENSIDRIIAQFRRGVWPQMRALQDAFELDRISQQGDSGIGNYIALSQPYDQERYEIEPDSVQVDLTHVLGSGEFGIVYSGQLLQGGSENWAKPLPVAIKKLQPVAEPSCVASFLKELQIMIYVGAHANVIQLLGACTQSNYIENMCIVLSLCAHGSLEKYLRGRRRVFVDQIEEGGVIGPGTAPLTSNYTYISMQAATYVSTTPAAAVSTEDLLRWTAQIAAGMEFLALKRVIHGDLAARNVLLDDGLVAKISDFGLASRLYECTRYLQPKAEERPLPWRWMAMESLQDMKFSTASDVWAFGITAWEVFSLAEVPYPGMVWGRQFMDQLVTGYRNVKPKYATEEIYSILRECWRHEPADRPTMAELRATLNDILEREFLNSSL